MSIAVGILAWVLLSAPFGILIGKLIKGVSDDYRVHLDPQVFRPHREGNVIAFRRR